MASVVKTAAAASLMVAAVAAYVAAVTAEVVAYSHQMGSNYYNQSLRENY